MLIVAVVFGNLGEFDGMFRLRVVQRASVEPLCPAVSFMFFFLCNLLLFAFCSVAGNDPLVCV